MGCNCKQVKKVGKKLNILDTPFYEKKGIKKILGWFKHTLWNILGALIGLISMIVVMPFIIVFVFFSILFNGKAVINLPFKGLLSKKNESEK